MPDACSKTLEGPKRRSVRWTSFVGSIPVVASCEVWKKRGIPCTAFAWSTTSDTLLIHISGEDGQGWTTLAIDRPTREWSIAQRRRQSDAAKAAYGNLYV